ncbi:FABP family protein [Corynebacterium glucuronolyticum]|uniref:Ferric nitrobindin-like protein n=2 Tax=Corynebacterium glucuronolyticum TaxID=39791 RepID=A0A7T4EHU9_9CORY|nr:FABP family protein [Corynebacterium glucuronolyticum]QQU89605.1 FABP family protein [Corynebacterium glucuronolyticum]WKD64398.1 hypothetical protein CGLUCO_10880 [Corynebacterium glucuronolyticum DSM 44120]SMB82997.1 protein of unknown function [Corynebacterium glucuronolyticum]
MGMSESASLDGNEAIGRAAEAAKSTSTKNILDTADIADLDATPHPVDTANLREGPNLHDGLLALLPLVGVWRGEGQAATDEGQFAFGQELVIAHNGENYLSYHSRTWKLDSEGKYAGPDTNAYGFWRVNDKDEIELISVRADGVVEIFYGEPYNERSWSLQSASTMVTETGPQALGPGKRMYGLMPNNHLGWVDERAEEQRSAELTRVVG